MIEITIDEFFKDYLCYVQTDFQTPKLNYLMALVAQNETSRVWVHCFTDLSLKPLELGIHDLVALPLAIIQKAPHCYLKSVQTNVDNNLKPIIVTLKEALESRERLAQKTVHKTQPIVPPPQLISMVSAPAANTVVQKPKIYKPRVLKKFSIESKPTKFNYNSAAFLISGIVLILLICFLLKNHIAAIPKRPAFFRPPLIKKISPKFDGSRVDIDCSKIISKFADFRTAIADQIQWCLNLLKIDETAVFTNTSEVSQKLSELAPDCEMQVLACNGKSYSAVAKVMRAGHEQLAAPSIGTMACLTHVLKHTV